MSTNDLIARTQALVVSGVFVVDQPGSNDRLMSVPAVCLWASHLLRRREQADRTQRDMGDETPSRAERGDE